jgi:heat shock protein HtpX
MMNNLKTLMLMALLGAIMIFIGGLVGGRTGMMFMLMISLGMNIFSYWFSDTMVLKMYGAQEVTREESPNLYDLVEQLAANAGLPMPRSASSIRMCRMPLRPAVIRPMRR